MKTLNCGELMLGCTERFQGETEDEILAQAGQHAVEVHNLEMTSELVETVRSHIRDTSTTAAADR